MVRMVNIYMKTFKRHIKESKLYDRIREIPPHRPDPKNVEFTDQNVEQEITSAATSTNIRPKTISMVEWTPNSVNLDYGGGKYDTATDALKGLSVTNLVYDPYNRSREHNKNVLSYALKNGVDTVTVNNVLNVIKEPEIRSNVISDAKKFLKKGGKAYFLIYAGDKSGEGKKTPRGWQNNLPATEYIDEIKNEFSNVSRKANLIIAQ
jgi:hypothetical protein